MIKIKLFKVFSEALKVQTKPDFAQLPQAFFFVKVGFRDHTLEGREFIEDRAIQDESTGRNTLLPGRCYWITGGLQA